MKNNIMSTFSGSFGKLGLKLKKASPEILVVVGVAGMVTSAVLACKATTKASQIEKEIEEERNEVEEKHADAELAKQGVYTEEDYKRDLWIVRKDRVLGYVKLYAPSVGLGLLSIGMIFGSHHILRKRNAALGTALATVTAAYKTYRSGVIERFSAAVDKELRQGVKGVVVKDGETGEEKTVNVADGTAASEYGRFFVKGIAKEADTDMDYNMTYVRAQQAFFNDLLKRRGHVYLNEVYDALGIERTKAGQIVGWVYNEKNPVGDNYIDFGADTVWKTDEYGELEKVLFLDFNVDGDILSLMR